MGYLMKWDKQLSTSFLPTTSSLMRASGSVKADAWYANGLMAQTVLRTVSIIVSAAGSVNFSSRNTLKPFGSRDSSKIGARTCRSITSSWNHQKKMIQLQHVFDKKSTSHSIPSMNTAAIFNWAVAAEHVSYFLIIKSISIGCTFIFIS